ncbi:hypothetical protein HOLDEFILI_02246 [Holdemania filiformis DSM 12042]|uniref:Uncharacterized protein n=1 Tax=Holdemania filiformis DSM 12042 TaxID=545696 RepID=B9Y8U6_9FIRM|nr:hypothetical protein HOLDEFILI_02246 [Holdemania filiformis DSM 12042]
MNWISTAIFPLPYRCGLFFTVSCASIDFINEQVILRILSFSLFLPITKEGLRNANSQSAV